MIKSFGSKDTERLRQEQFGKTIDRNVQRSTLRKPEVIHAAAVIENLRVPPGNRLEQSKGDRQGQHSIRVNDQGLICFVRRGGGGHDDVELVDYH